MTRANTEQDAAAKAATDAAAAKAATDAAAAADAEAATKAAADTAAAAAAAKNADGTDQQGNKGKDGAPAAPKAPETYTLTAPEGGRVTAEDLTQIETFARANNLSNDQAQALVAQHDANVQATFARYLDETKADPTYGGANLEESQQLARSVIDRVRPEGHARRASFISFLDRVGGVGNHLEVVAFLADLGRMMAEDSHGMGRGGGSGERRPTEEILFKSSSAA